MIQTAGKRSRMINVAVLGYGTIGSGVVEVLNINRENIAKRAGKEIHFYRSKLIRKFEKFS